MTFVIREEYPEFCYYIFTLFEKLKLLVIGGLVVVAPGIIISVHVLAFLFGDWDKDWTLTILYKPSCSVNSVL